MKKVILLLIIALFTTACGIYNMVNPIDELASGMNKREVAYLLGRPERVLEVNYTRDGIQEILEYRDSYNDFYALEFWDDYLVSYQFLPNSGRYVIAPTPPSMIPPRGRPIIIIGNNNRSGNSSRPNSRPNTSRPSSGNSGRPSSSNRPTTNNGRSSSRDIDRTTTNRPSSSNTDSSNSSRRSSSRTSASDRNSEKTEANSKSTSSYENKSSGRSQSSERTESNSTNGRSQRQDSGRSSSRSSSR